MPLNINSVPYFDLKSYLGKWYQIATIPSWFQREMVRVTAEYSIRTDDKIKVDNIGYGRITGIKNRIIGVAEKATTNIDSWLLVRFFFGKSDYFVLEIDENYQWALVGGSNANNLWILSRTPQISPELIQSIKQKAIERGYNTQKLVITQ